MSARRNHWFRAFFALGAGALLVLNLPSTAKAVLTIELSSVVTDAAGVVLATPQDITNSAAFPGPVTIPTPSGTNVGGGLIVTGVLGAASTASGPNTFINNTIGSLLSSLVDQISNNTGATRIATVVISANGYEAPVPATISFNFTSTFVNAAGSSITARFLEDPANGRSRITGTVGTTTVTETLVGNAVGGVQGPFNVTTNASTAFSSQGVANLPSNTPFGLTLEFRFTLTSGGNLQSRAQSELVLPAAAVPEPSTAVMAICGLPVLGGLALRRRLRRA